MRIKSESRFQVDRLQIIIAVQNTGTCLRHQYLMGDGNRNYGRENIIEFYYTAHIWRGIFASFDLQHINSPSYNRDRGPVLVPTLRLHIDLQLSKRHPAPEKCLGI